MRRGRRASERARATTRRARAPRTGAARSSVLVLPLPSPSRRISSFSPPTATITLDDTSCAGLGLLGTLAAACWRGHGRAAGGDGSSDGDEAGVVACDALAAIGLHFTDVRVAVRLHAVEIAQAVLLHLAQQAVGEKARLRARAAAGLLLEFALPAAAAVMALAFRPGVGCVRPVEQALLEAAASAPVAPHAARVLAFARSALSGAEEREGGEAEAAPPRELLCAKTVVASLRLLQRVFVALLPLLMDASLEAEGEGDHAARVWAPIAAIFSASLRACSASPAARDAVLAMQAELVAQCAVIGA